MHIQISALWRDPTDNHPCHVILAGEDEKAQKSFDYHRWYYETELGYTLEEAEGYTFCTTCDGAGRLPKKNRKNHAYWNDAAFKVCPTCKGKEHKRKWTVPIDAAKPIEACEYARNLYK